MKQGITILESDVSKPRWRADRDHLQVDMSRTPKHMDTISLRGGSAYVDNAPLPATQREVLHQFEHGYPRAPYSLTFFYVEKVDFAETGSFLEQGGYGNDFYLLSGSGGSADDIIFAEVDDKYFRIVHELRGYGSESGAVSKAPQYLFKVKYYISSLSLAG